MSSSAYNASSARQRLNDIAAAFINIRNFVGKLSRDEFVAPEHTIIRYAVVRALEEACEAAYWFTKNENGSELRRKYPEVNFAHFGRAGNVFRHQYGNVDYGIVWDDIFTNGPDILPMEKIARSRN